MLKWPCLGYTELIQAATSKNMSKINFICFFYFLDVAARKFKIMYVAWILFLSDSTWVDQSSNTWLTIRPHPVLRLKCWGLHRTHTWHADLHMIHTCLQVHVCIHVALCTYVLTHICVHACLHLNFSMFSVCEHPGGSPMWRHAQARAHVELTWGQGLGREASGWLSTPGGSWNRQCFLGKLTRMSCKIEPTAALKSRQMTAPSHPHQWGPSLYHCRGN